MWKIKIKDDRVIKKKWEEQYTRRAPYVTQCESNYINNYISNSHVIKNHENKHIIDTYVMYKYHDKCVNFIKFYIIKKGYYFNVM